MFIITSTLLYFLHHIDFGSDLEEIHESWVKYIFGSANISIIDFVFVKNPWELTELILAHKADWVDVNYLFVNLSLTL